MSTDLRARDVLSQLTPRVVVGHRLGARVGARAWEPPRFARGRAIFQRIGVPNPWDPAAPEVGVGLGDVGLPQARQPAPHLQPPAAAAKPAAKAPAFPNIPGAPRRPAGDEAPKPGKAAPKIGEVRKFDPSELKPKDSTPQRARPISSAPPPTGGAFGPGAPKHAVAKLPMRPGVVPPGAEPAPAPIAAPAPRPAPPPSPPSVAAPPRPAPPTPPSAAAPPRPPPPSPVAPPRPPPEPPPPAEPPPPPKPAAPVNRKPPGPSAGLDDLFGMGGENTRIRLPKAEPAEGEAARPRRPMVTSPEELARLGLDRRPPPPKPPAVVPTAAPAPRAEPEPDDD